jgi:hypothetical protein
MLFPFEVVVDRRAHPPADRGCRDVSVAQATLRIATDAPGANASPNRRRHFDLAHRMALRGGWCGMQDH